MSHSNRVANEDHTQLTRSREFIDIKEAAICYGCQVNDIRDFIARNMLHMPLDRQEIEELRRKHLYKQINGRSSPRWKRR